jgi:dihydrolipoamide dehydrogenase
MALIEVAVPDIGDFDEVEVIELLVQVGDRIAKEQSLVTVESDKASMEIPSSADGLVKTLHVKLGDKVKKGSALVSLEASADAKAGGDAKPSSPQSTAAAAALAEAAPAQAALPVSAPAPAAPAPAAAALAQPALASQAKAPAGADTYDVVVLGAGPGGYSAAFRAADLGQRVALIERDEKLGGVCLKVGCIPSKALLHVAQVMDEAAHFADYGVTYQAPVIDLARLREHKNKVVDRLTGGLAQMARGRKVDVIRGSGSFVDANHVTVEGPDGTRLVAFKNAIIAAGSEAVHLPFAPGDARIVDSTGALELPLRPNKMLIIGGGIIGLEMGTVYSTLGARLDVVEMLDGLMAGADRDLVRIWQKVNQQRFDRIMLKTKTTAIEARADGVWVTFEGEGAPKEAQRYDLVLQAVGRLPNGLRINAKAAGIEVSERGFISVDRQMRTNVANIFAIGDIVGQPMLAHKAVHEGHIAAEVAAGHKAFFDARVIPSVAYTDPEVAWVGLTEDEAKANNIAVGKAVFPWAASGRAIANGRDEGATKLLFDPNTHQLLGGAIVGLHAGDLISELALAVEMGADATDIARTIHPHPTLGESVGMAAELFEGVCTDLPPVKKKA